MLAHFANTWAVRCYHSMTPSLEIERLLFSGSVNKGQLGDLMLPYTDNFSFIGYNDFSEIHWLNTPGPVYTTYTDNCGTGQVEAMNNVGGDEDYHEVVFKQPSNRKELIEVLSAALVDPFGAYYFGGNESWTKELIQEWWSKSDKRIAYILDLYECELHLPEVILDRPLYGPRESIPDNYKNWLDFYQTGMKEYLEWYIFKLTNQKINLAKFIFDWTRKQLLDDKFKARIKSR